ncbi:MAG: ATP synthase F1 subunit epsilon [Acidobacteriota bacterium]|nr:ATP synthase F1 subunit epsilon [Acidobacteriota bacterium]
MAEATANQIRVRLVTPERILFEHMATSVELPSKSGYMEVLYGHAPLMAELGAGDVTLNGGPEGMERYNVSWGFVEVLGDRVTILAADALKPSEIDLARAEKQLDRGLEEWKQAGENEEAYTEALRVIAEAEAKISSAKNQ